MDRQSSSARILGYCSADNVLWRAQFFGTRSNRRICLEDFRKHQGETGLCCCAPVEVRGKQGKRMDGTEQDNTEIGDSEELEPLSYFKHPQALVESTHIGARTRIWAFAHVLPGAVIGEDCNICVHVFIENDVRVGNRVTIKCGVQLWDGLVLEDDVFVGPNATFTNDIFPRSQK